MNLKYLDLIMTLTWILSALTGTLPKPEISGQFKFGLPQSLWIKLVQNYQDTRTWPDVNLKFQAQVKPDNSD